MELFETTGQVVLAEILFEGTRSKGSGIVQFKEVAEATEACEKFTGYVYGGRPLGEFWRATRHAVADYSPQTCNTTTGGTTLLTMPQRVEAYPPWRKTRPPMSSRLHLESSCRLPDTKKLPFLYHLPLHSLVSFDVPLLQSF